MSGLTGNTNRVLLLQGPMGSFFARFADYLMSHGAQVWKINFNGGDLLFSGRVEAFNFRDSLEEWPAYLAKVVQEHRIDRIFLFGDCRAYHQLALKVAKAAGVRVFVFEEGYIRPDYITLEENGVNGFSSLPRDREFYEQLGEVPHEQSPVPAHTSFRKAAWSAIFYYLAGALLCPYFHHYDHHKCFSVPSKSIVWVRSWLRKLAYTRRDKALTGRLAISLSKQYFLAVLQVHNDAQIHFHSKYEDIQDFIQEILQSFAEHAPADKYLVLKHHPLDRGDRHYGRLVDRLSQEYGIADRVIYAHQIHLPTALNHACGVVVVNSTVGLSALWHDAPVKAMGSSVYNIDGLACQKPLEQFWTDPGKVNVPLLAAFRHHIIAKTQINGSYYGLAPFEVSRSAFIKPVKNESASFEDDSLSSSSDLRPV